jgi:predicted MFS family arabinose efflux permease
MSRILETVAPARLGRNLRWVLAAVTVMNLGDGVVVAAGPLLVASQTRDPFLVSLAVFAEYVPTLVVGTLAGVIADRVDRKRLTVAMNLGRSVALVILAWTILSGQVSIGLILLMLLVLGTAETFADLGSTSLLPSLVPRSGLGLANARIQGSSLLTNQLIGPPIGAFLFAAGMAIPFVADAAGFALGAVLLSRIVMPEPRTSDAAAAPATTAEAPTGSATARGQATVRGLWTDLVEGFRWLRGHPPMRTLALTIFAFNVTYGAAWSVLVLYSRDRLGMDSVGFGFRTTAIAIGGIIGTTSYGRLERRFSLADIMRVGLLIETLTHLGLALTRSSGIALVIMVVFGAHAVVWGTTSTTVRQRAVPDALMGRVSGIYRVGLNAGIVVGTPIGGLLARGFGITAPFWFGFIGSAILLAILWRQFDHIVHAGDVPTA